MADELKVTMSTDSIKAIMGEAILRSIDQESRDGLIKQALENLIAKPVGNSFSRYDSKSPLERAFECAADAVARDIIREQLTADQGFKDKIRMLITEAVDKLLNDKREQTVSQISDAISSSLKLTSS